MRSNIQPLLQRSTRLLTDEAGPLGIKEVGLKLIIVLIVWAAPYVWSARRATAPVHAPYVHVFVMVRMGYVHKPCHFGSSRLKTNMK